MSEAKSSPRQKKTTSQKATPSKATTKKTTAPKTKTEKAAARKKPAHKLVIVESPAKARTVSNFLGKDYVVMASKGHVRDLLVTQLSVDVQNDFEPTYRVLNDKRAIVNELKKAVKDAEMVFLATDPDREGEAIAWHLVAAAEIPPERFKRVVFHEITKPAIEEAFAHPRGIDDNLVNAQQARRILDRLVGYNITELLWDKVRNRLSAGRVQSIALRMVVDREREIEQFTPVEYWTIDAELKHPSANGKNKGQFLARLVKIGDADAELGSEEAVKPHLEVLERSQYIVSDYKTGTRQRKPSPPFTTSTLQQEASRRLGFNASRTMKTAQSLYEGIELGKNTLVGLITYMRTDSVNVSRVAQAEAAAYIHERFGAAFLPPEPPQYKTKAKGAQEAHEAIRPTSVQRDPASIRAYLSTDQYKLYKLIWERFVASQMANAIYDTVRIDVKAGLTPEDMPYLFRANGSRVKFSGFLALYEDSKDEDALKDSDEGRVLPELRLNDVLTLLKLLPEQHFTQPPPRFTEATLVKALEEYGIGRPSTYAPTVAVIQDRDYVTKVDKRLVPTETGKIVSELLATYFPNEMDYQFTARMEEQLDDIAEGSSVWKPMLREFYTPFEQHLQVARETMPKIKQEISIGRTCPACQTGNLIIRYGRWGKFIGCSNYPACNYTEQYLEKSGIPCPVCGSTHGGEVVERRTRSGKLFYGCSRYPECNFSAWKLPKPEETAADAPEGVADALPDAG